MFSPGVISRRIDLASAQLVKNSPLDSRDQPIFKPGFRLQYHTINQVAQANSHLDELIGEDGRATRPFTVEEIRWVRNERALCRCDFFYWASRYAFIINWLGQLIRFDPNTAQRIALNIFADLEAREIAILLQFLKARQLGVTTLTELVILHRAMFFPRTNALVASSDPDKSRIMAEKMELCLENQPYWMSPTLTAYRKGEIIEFKRQNSAISIQHGTQMSGLARGTTPTAFHLSEIPDYRNPSELIDASLLRAVHDSPWIFGLLESTAAGRNNYWHKKWKFNVENWPLGRSRLCPAFLPWFVGSDIYPTPTFLRARPIPPQWRPRDLTISHANRAKEYVRSNQLLSKFLGSTWEMPPEQMWFWEVTRAEYEADNRLHEFYQELCADDKEAFQTSNISVFSVDTLSRFRESCNKMPVGVFGLRAPQAEVPAHLQPKDRDIDPNLPPLHIKCNWSQVGQTHNYTLYPLLHHPPAPFDPLGKIIMYEFPRDNKLYGLGTDVSMGLGQDNSVIEVIRKGDIEENDSQVCEFSSPWINSFALWPFNLALGTLYSTRFNGQLRQAKQVIEMAANGENTQLELWKRGWRNFHLWIRYDKKSIVESKATRLGWYTMEWSRRMMLDMLLDALNNDWLDINSPWFVDEMADLELDVEKMRLAAVSGAHDDRLMALGIVLFSLHALETRHKANWITRERIQRRDPHPQFAKYSEGLQGSDLSDAVRDRTLSHAYEVITGSDPSYPSRSSLLVDPQGREIE
jgi:hypothetical protein